MARSKLSRVVIPTGALVGLVVVVLVAVVWSRLRWGPARDAAVELEDDDPGPPVVVSGKLPGPPPARFTTSPLPMPTEFQGPAAELSPEEAAEFDALFRQPRSGPADGTPAGQDMGEAINRPYTDYERLHEEILRLSVLAELQPIQRVALRTRLGYVVLRLDQVASTWKSATVLKVRFSPNQREALVSIRHEPTDGPAFTARWWLVRRRQGWVAYDTEKLGQGLRSSVEQALSIACVGWAEGDKPAWSASIRTLREVGDALARGDADLAAEKLRTVPEAGLPPGLAAQRWLHAGALAVLQGRPRDALRDFDEALHWNPDVPGVLPYRSTAHAQLGETEPAAQDAREFLDLVGDTETFAALACHLERAGRPAPEILTAVRLWLDVSPDNPALVDALRRHLPAGEKGEVGVRLARLARPAERFAVLADKAVEERDFAGLEALLAVGRPPLGADPEHGFYTVLLSIGRGRPDDAARLYPAVDRAARDDRQRQKYRAGFLTEMTAAGRTLAGYRAVPDAAAAFRLLADSIDGAVDEGDAEAAEQLRKLVAAHRERQPNDPALPYFAGRLAAGEKDFDAADRHFAAGLALHLTDEQRAKYQFQRVRARYLAGQWEAAYRELGPPEATFLTLAALMSRAKNLDQLVALIGAHRRSRPTDPNLLAWDIELLWLKKDYAGVARYLRINREPLTDGRYRVEQFRDRLVRSLHRLGGRSDEIEQTAQDYCTGRQQILFLTLAAAAQGDAELATSHVEENLLNLFGGRFPTWYYSDPDLGPLLRGDAFKNLRAKYPPPAEPAKPAAP